MAKYLIIIFCFAVFSCASAPKEWTVESPDGRICSIVRQGKTGLLTYSVNLKDKDGKIELIKASPLGIERLDQVFDTLILISASKSGPVKETYDMITGKRLKNTSQYTEIVLNFTNRSRSKLDVVFRAYNEGIAFKYIFPETENNTYTVVREITGFSLPHGQAWLQPYDTITAYAPAYERNYEGPLETGTLSPGKEGWCFPALFEIDNRWVLITEANLKSNFYASHLNQTDSNSLLYSICPPEAEEAFGYGKNTATHSLPWEMPWRVIMAGSTLADIVESNLVFHVSAPPASGIPSWIRTGRASWGWWSGFLDRSTDTPEKLRKFIDLAHDMGWEYSLVDASWDTRRGVDISELAEYARERDVKLMLWYNAGGPINRVNAGPRDRMFDPKIRRAEMKRIAEIGISGIKVDFFSSDKQDFIQLYIDILEDALANNLMVNFHGCTAPRGWSRTYPNLMTMESVKGAEAYIYHSDFQEKGPMHKTILPFTRNVIGSMDYTPVAFSTSYVPHRTSYGFELALAVTFESGIQHFPDQPEVYLGLPDDVKSFLQQVPTAWDDTRFLSGYPAKDIVIAREKDNIWFIGGINGEDIQKEFLVNFEFLAKNHRYKATIITDGENNKSFSSSTKTITKESVETVRVLPVGGFAMTLVPENQ